MWITKCRHSDSNRDALALVPKTNVSTNFTMAARGGTELLRLYYNRIDFSIAFVLSISSYLSFLLTFFAKRLEDGQYDLVILKNFGQNKKIRVKNFQ